MLIVKITKGSKVVYHGCVRVSVENLDAETRRVRMFTSSGLKIISDVDRSHGVQIQTDMVLL